MPETFSHPIRVSAVSSDQRVAGGINERTNRMMKNAVVTPKTQGGAQRNKEIVGLYPSVAANVGKKFSYDIITFKEIAAIASHHTVQSDKASTRPDRPLRREFSAPHTSSTIRF